MFKVKSFLAVNQAVLSEGNRVIFQSYDSVIAIVEDGKVSLSEHYEYSKTTMKYLCKFLGAKSILEVRKSIKSGEYKIDIDISGDKLIEGING